MDTKKTFLLIIGLVLLVGGFFAAFKLTAKDSKTTTSNDQTQSQVTQTPSDGVDSAEVQGSQKLTLEEVKKHNTFDDCWTIISGNVYDLTSYVQDHPGGEAILKACGTDGTTLFNERKTSDGEVVGSGTPHDTEAKSQLQDFLLGSLEN